MHQAGAAGRHQKRGSTQGMQSGGQRKIFEGCQHPFCCKPPLRGTARPFAQKRQVAANFPLYPSRHSRTHRNPLSRRNHRPECHLPTQRQHMLVKPGIVVGLPTHAHPSRPCSPLSDQRMRIINSEASSDFVRNAICTSLKSAPERVGNFGGQGDATRVIRAPVVGKRTRRLQQAIDAFVGESPSRPTRAIMGAPPARLPGTLHSAREKPVQRIDQSRQIRLSRVVWPHEHGQRTKINLRACNWPKVRHFDLCGLLRVCVVHRVMPPASASCATAPARSREFAVPR